MKKFIKSISIVMSFLMTFLLVDPSLANAVSISEAFGYQNIVITKLDDGSREMKVCFDNDEIGDIQPVYEEKDTLKLEDIKFKDKVIKSKGMQEETLNISSSDENVFVKSEPKSQIEIISVNKNFKDTASLEELSFSITYKCPKQLEKFSLAFFEDKEGRIFLESREISDNADGTYTVNISSKSYIDTLKYSLSGKYKLSYVEFKEAFGSSSFVYNSAKNYDYGEQYDFSNLDFELENPNEDRTPPRVTEIKLDKQIVTPGEKVKLRLKIEDDNSGVMMAYVGYPFSAYEMNQFQVRDVVGNALWFFNYIPLRNNATILVKSDLNEKIPPTIISNIKDGSTFVNEVKPYITTDHGTFEMELDGKKYDGSEIKGAGIHTLYIKATGVDGSITTDKFTFEVVKKFVIEMNEDTKVEEIINQIVNSSEQNIQVTLNTKEKVVSKEIFEAIKGQDKNVTFTPNDGAEWTFNGKDIKDGANISDIKLSIKYVSEDEEASSTIENAADDAMIIHFDYHGELPGKTVVKIFAGDRKDLIGKEITFYYYNAETKEIEKVQGPLVIGKDGFVTVEITHCSDYFLSANNNLATVEDETIINLTTKSLNLNIGDTKKIISVVDNQGDNAITYSSLDEKIVSVDKEGNVKALAAGNTKVKVECNGVVAFVDIVVNSNENNNVVIVPDKDDVTIVDKETSETGEGNKVSNSGAAKTGDIAGNIGFLVLLAALSATVLAFSSKKKLS